ncbi:hypothetical protein CEXT_432181 [Caerostris extrusa]|uniref:Uncharacterized protein n=1 Tax=Caerostris extrusa TaxID=172846 RepID=A0AAV4XBT3_CAEEX|nr:hypothetical protein CEXT_432181 [Caerostris extrusa]
MKNPDGVIDFGVNPTGYPNVTRLSKYTHVPSIGSQQILNCHPFPLSSLDTRAVTGDELDTQVLLIWPTDKKKGIQPDILSVAACSDRSAICRPRKPLSLLKSEESFGPSQLRFIPANPSCLSPQIPAA